MDDQTQNTDQPADMPATDQQGSMPAQEPSAPMPQPSAPGAPAAGMGADMPAPPTNANDMNMPSDGAGSASGMPQAPKAEDGDDAGDAS